MGGWEREWQSERAGELEHMCGAAGVCRGALRWGLLKEEPREAQGDVGRKGELDFNE